MTLTPKAEAQLRRAAQEQYVDGRDELNQMLGAFAASTNIEKSVQFQKIAAMSRIKERKLYKAIGDKPLMLAGIQVEACDTWDTFCTQLGFDRATLDEKILNIKTLGLEAAEAFDQLGVSLRDMRKIRKLEDEDKQKLIELINQEDQTPKQLKAAIKDEVELLLSKAEAAHQAELAETSNKLDDTAAQLQASRNQSDKIADELEETREKLDDYTFGKVDTSTLISDLTTEASAASNQIVIAAANINNMQEKIIAFDCDEKTKRQMMSSAFAVYQDAIQRAAADFIHFQEMAQPYVDDAKASQQFLNALSVQYDERLFGDDGQTGLPDDVEEID